ncbi:hypothetical protein Hanom_Chr06g00479401 [Helianthus anomalus]
MFPSFINPTNSNLPSTPNYVLKKDTKINQYFNFCIITKIINSMAIPTLHPP